MQDAVKNEDAHFVAEGATEPLRVAPRDSGGDGDVAEILGYIFRRSRGRRRGPRDGQTRAARPACRTPLTMLSRSCRFCLGHVCWEGQYIGRAIFSTVGAIPARYLRVGDESDRKRAGPEAQAFARGGEKFLEAGNGNTNATLVIEDHARGLIPRILLAGMADVSGAAAVVVGMGGGVLVVSLDDALDQIVADDVAFIEISE